MNNMLVNRIEFFGETLKIATRLDFWSMDPELNLIESTCEDAIEVYNIFSTGECYKYLKEYIFNRCPKPLLLSNSIGMTWIATLDIKANNVCGVFMIGPSFPKEKSTEEIDHYLIHKKFTKEEANIFAGTIANIPIVLLPTMQQFGTMLHFAVTGENVQFDEFNYQTTAAREYASPNQESKPAPKNQTWYFEQRAMEMIETGNLEYKNVLIRLGEVGKAYIPSASEDYMRNVKNSILSFITLSTRAAIYGGLDPETAYTIGQRYADSAEKTDTLSDLVSINTNMYADFVQRVHKVKQQHGISPTIANCQDYIELHLREKISLRELAKKYNYSESRLAQKFKEEIGISITQYMKKRRIEQAKKLLDSTNESIQTIGEELGFCNTSYFVESFRELTGMTPREYKNRVMG